MSKNWFDLTGRVAVITGGTGLLGQQHAEAIAGAGGIPVLADINVSKMDIHSPEFTRRFGSSASVFQVDITSPDKRSIFTGCSSK